MKLNTKMIENVQSNLLILVKKIISPKKSPPFNLKLSSVMDLILTCIHWCFIWHFHYFLSILSPILSPGFMKHGTYHKTNLLSMAFIELLSSFHDESTKYIDFWSIFWKWWSTNLAHWNGVANSYLVSHGAIAFHSKWV